MRKTGRPDSHHPLAGCRRPRPRRHRTASSRRPSDPSLVLGIRQAARTGRLAWLLVQRRSRDDAIDQRARPRGRHATRTNPHRDRRPLRPVRRSTTLSLGGDRLRTGACGPARSRSTADVRCNQAQPQENGRVAVHTTCPIRSVSQSLADAASVQRRANFRILRWSARRPKNHEPIPDSRESAAHRESRYTRPLI